MKPFRFDRKLLTNLTSIMAMELMALIAVIIIAAAAAETLSVQTISDSEIKLYSVTDNCASETLVHSAVTVFNSVGDGKHDSCQTNVGTIKRVVKGRRLLFVESAKEPTKPKLDQGQIAQHN